MTTDVVAAAAAAILDPEREILVLRGPEAEVRKTLAAVGLEATETIR